AAFAWCSSSIRFTPTSGPAACKRAGKASWASSRKCWRRVRPAVTFPCLARRHVMLVGRAVVVVTTIAACGDNGLPASPGDPQTPPTGAPQLAAWLGRGYYEQWACELSIHDSRSPSPHGANRVCSNDLVSGAGAGGDDW